MADMATIFPPALLGHDEQELLKNSGLPAAAWVHDTRVVPDPKRPGEFKFQAMMGEAAPVVAQLINQRAYRKTSAEIYDEPPAGCRNIPGVSGKVLRAVAFLGGEQPKVKTLDDIPRFNDKGQSTGWVDVFATGEYDGIKYKRADLDDMQRNHKLLCRAGVDPSTFAEIGGATGVGRRVFMETSEDTPMDELRQKLIAAGVPEAVVNAMDETALKTIVDACAGAAGGNVTPGTVPATVAGEGGPAMQTGSGKGTMSPGDGTPTTDPKVYSEIADKVTKQVLLVLNQAGTAGAAAVERVKEIDRGTARRLFSDKVVKLLDSGHIAPSVNEGGLIESIAEGLATETKVARFSEGGKEKEMSLEARFGLLIDRLGNQKPVPVKERHSGGDVTKFSETEKAAEKETVKAHFQRYSDRFLRAGTTEAKYLKAFEHSGQTAEEYTGERA